MEKSNKNVITLLIIILIAILGIGGYFIYALNNKIEDHNKSIADLKSENQKNQKTIENILNSNNQNSNTQSTTQNNTTSTSTTASNQPSDESIVKDLFIAKLKELNNSNSEKLLDYRVDKVKILSDSEKQPYIGTEYNSTDILAIVTYSVKPKNVNSSNWVAGNGEISGEWIINKTACECLRNGKLLDTTSLSTNF